VKVDVIIEGEIKQKIKKRKNRRKNPKIENQGTKINMKNG